MLLCPTEETCLLMSSMYIEMNVLYAGSGHVGGEGHARGAGAFGLEQGT